MRSTTTGDPSREGRAALYAYAEAPSILLGGLAL
jgi:hypothetical protein